MDLLDIQTTLREFELERYNIHNLLIKVLRIAKYRLDVKEIIFMSLNKSSSLTNDKYLALYSEIKTIAIKKGLSSNEYKTIFVDVYENYYKNQRTTDWYELTSKSVEKGYVVGLSVSELTDYINQIEKVLETNTIPEGLHSLDLYYENEKKQKLDGIYLNHLGSCKSILNKIRDYLIDYLVNVESEMVINKELDDMDFKNELLILIQQGHEVKAKCSEVGLYGTLYISGADYIAWIEKCKLFIKKHVSDTEIQENFFNIAKGANESGETPFNSMIGILTALQDYDFTPTPVVHTDINKKIDKIFISHSSKDIEYVTALVDLLNNIGIKKSDKHIFCSSLTGYDIPYGENIYEFLKLELNNNNIMVLFVLSHNYYESAPSLNEMGAAWITSKEHNSVLTPNFDFKKITGAIDPTKISFYMNDKDGLNKFRDTIVKTFELDEIDYKIWDRDRKIFTDKVDAIAKTEALNLNTQVKLERVKKLNENKMELHLRFINITDKEIEFKFIDLELGDSSGNKLNMSVDEDLLDEFRLYPRENKIVKWTFDYGSSYNPRRDDSKLSKISFEIYS
ncbi:toll/interleukin-1 receptor domain-containing protein [Peribacillus sp. NPDC056705]|uniref:toll/interleukin-1 receptor domain-containing protein n=1 Tax=Peribacillus sp. NPDC056705 TaxID=3345918 RepID=UPI00374A50D6